MHGFSLRLTQRLSDAVRPEAERERVADLAIKCVRKMLRMINLELSGKLEISTGCSRARLGALRVERPGLAAAADKLLAQEA